MRGMTLRAIAEACNGVYYGSEDNLDKEVTDITTDSRKVRRWFLWWYETACTSCTGIAG